jgi:hypothetical protein
MNYYLENIEQVILFNYSKKLNISIEIDLNSNGYIENFYQTRSGDENIFPLPQEYSIYPIGDQTVSLASTYELFNWKHSLSFQTQRRSSNDLYNIKKMEFDKSYDVLLKTLNNLYFVKGLNFTTWQENNYALNFNLEGNNQFPVYQFEDSLKNYLLTYYGI